MPDMWVDVQHGCVQAERSQHTIYTHGSVGRAGVHEALAGGVGGREVGADERLQHRVAAERLHADVVRVRHHVAARREVRPPVVPASACHVWLLHAIEGQASRHCAHEKTLCACP